MAELPKLTVVAEGLRFPEGPIAMPDGSVILVEICLLYTSPSPRD